MTNVHSYTLQGNWIGTKLGVGHLQTQGLASDVSIPVNLNGPGIGTNPEELLLSAASGCYLITLSALLTNREIPYLRIELESEGYVENDHGLRYDRIEHRPTIVVDHAVDELTLHALARHAEHACMISSALRGNVAVSVVPQILVQEPSR